MRPRLDLSVYVVLDLDTTAAEAIVTLAQAAAAGGATLLQLRDKRGPARRTVELARALIAAVDLPLVVNDRVDVAVAADAVGAHVGQDDLPAAAARAILGPDRVLGLSVTAAGELGTVDPALVDHVGLGPIFPTATKPDAAAALGVEGFAAIRRRLALPVVAIGGLGPDNAAQAITAGADGIAVVSAVAAAADPAAATARLAALVARARRARAA